MIKAFCAAVKKTKSTFKPYINFKVLYELLYFPVGIFADGVKGSREPKPSAPCGR